MSKASKFAEGLVKLSPERPEPYLVGGSPAARVSDTGALVLSDIVVEAAQVPELAHWLQETFGE